MSDVTFIHSSSPSVHSSFYYITHDWFSTHYRFHTGSLAFGALIIAIIQLIRIILAYIQKKLKKNKESKIAHAILTCMQCCFYLLEKVFRYINRHAYIEIAIYGYDFCTGACKAVKLILRNIITYVHIHVCYPIGPFPV